MTKQEFREVKQKYEEYIRLQKAIDNLAKILKIISIGKCISVDFKYRGIARPDPGRWDDDGELYGEYVQRVSTETIGISEDEYSEWFSKTLLEHISGLRNALQQKLDEL